MPNIVARRRTLQANCASIDRLLGQACPIRAVTKSVQDDPIVVAWLHEAGLTRFATFATEAANFTPDTDLDWMELNPHWSVSARPGVASALLTLSRPDWQEGVMPVLALQTGSWPLGSAPDSVIAQVRRLVALGEERVGIAINYGCTEKQPPVGAKRLIDILDQVRHSCGDIRLHVSAGGSALLAMGHDDLALLARQVDEFRIGEALLLGSTPAGPASGPLDCAFALHIEPVEQGNDPSTLTLDVGWMDIDEDDLTRHLQPHRLLALAQHHTLVGLEDGHSVSTKMSPNYQTLCRAYASKNVKKMYSAA